MLFFDTHAHFEGTAEETSAALQRAVAAGVTCVMAVGGSETLNSGVARAAAVAPLGATVWRCLGWDRDQIAKEHPSLDYTGVAAVGEIGLDYYYSSSTRLQQRALFAEQLDAARQRNLPAVIHTRDAQEDTLGLLREIPARGVIHCFTGDVPFCRALLDLGWFISFSGIVTFRSAETVRIAARYVPADRLLIETDAPFLAPVPLRGRVNEPAYLVHTASALAQLRGVSLDVLAAVTRGNALTLLGEAPKQEVSS